MNNQNSSYHPEQNDHKCIGSFVAFASDNTRHVVEIWTHRAAIHYGDVKRISPGMLFLTTKDGKHVERIDQGEYRVAGNPEIKLSSNDLEAP